MQGLTLEGVRQKLKEFHDAIGEEGGEEDVQRQRTKVMNLLTGLGYEKPEEPAPQPAPEAHVNGTANAGNPAVQCACNGMKCLQRYQAAKMVTQHEKAVNCEILCTAAAVPYEHAMYLHLDCLRVSDVGAVPQVRHACDSSTLNVAAC